VKFNITVFAHGSERQLSRGSQHITSGPSPWSIDASRKSQPGRRYLWARSATRRDKAIWDSRESLVDRCSIQTLHQFSLVTPREAAYALLQYIQPPADLIFDPPFIPVSPSQSPMTILELGSGTGIVASCIANVLDASEHIFIATDLPEVSRTISKPSQLTSKGLPIAREKS